MMTLGRGIRAIVSAEMRTRERSVIRVALAVIAVGAVAGGARAAQADLTEAALLLLVTVLAVGTLGFPSGIAAAIVGFLALNWLFTEPTGSFKIHRTDDIVALAVFAASAALVGWTVQRLSTLRRTALQREAEAKMRLDLTNRLLTGADVDDALHSAADALATLFAFEACTLTAGPPLAAADEPARANVRVDGPGVTLLARARQPLTPPDRELLEALVAGLAAGIDRLRLQEE